MRHEGGPDLMPCLPRAIFRKGCDEIETEHTRERDVSPHHVAKFSGSDQKFSHHLRIIRILAPSASSAYQSRVEHCTLSRVMPVASRPITKTTREY